MLDLVYTGVASGFATFVAIVMLMTMGVKRSHMVIGAGVLFACLFALNLMAMIVEAARNKSCHLVSAAITAGVGVGVYIMLPFVLRNVPYLNRFAHNTALILAVAGATTSWRFVNAHLLRNAC